MSMNVDEQLEASCYLSSRKGLGQMSSIPVTFMRPIILFIGMLRLTVPKAVELQYLIAKLSSLTLNLVFWVGQQRQIFSKTGMWCVSLCICVCWSINRSFVKLILNLTHFLNARHQIMFLCVRGTSRCVWYWTSIELDQSAGVATC